jgi:hypothetical protein
LGTSHIRPQSGLSRPWAKACAALGLETEARHEHIASQHPEGLAQQRQALGHAASGFQRATVVAPFMRVTDAQSPAAAIAQHGRELVFQVGGVDDHVTHSVTRQGLQVPHDQRLALHHQQRLGAWCR